MSDLTKSLFLFKKDSVSLGGEWFSVKCSVTLFCTQGSSRKWSWLDVTRGSSHVYVFEGCFSPAVFWFNPSKPSGFLCDQSEMSSWYTTAEPRDTHRKLFAHRMSWGYVVVLLNVWDQCAVGWWLFFFCGELDRKGVKSRKRNKINWFLHFWYKTYFRQNMLTLSDRYISRQHFLLRKTEDTREATHIL